MKVTGIILAGGRSRRMGRDKALLPLGGKPMISYVIGALEQVADPVILVGNNPALDVFGLTRVPDMWEQAGPLAGICTGLQHSASEYNLVLGCDTPLVNKTILTLLLSHASDAYDVVQLATAESSMPLLALYRKSCLKSLLDLVRSGERRLQESVATLRTRTLKVDASMERFTMNVNTPEDLDRLQDLRGEQEL